MDRLRPFLPLIVLALLTAVAITVIQQRREAAHAERLRLERAVGAVPLGGMAPDVTLFDRSETPTKLSSFRGRVVFVNFWATWCGPCIAEMPSLYALHAALDPDDVVFVSIAEDDYWQPVDQWLRRNRMPFELFRDRPPRVEKLFETTSYPTSFLIDREGRAVYRFNGTRRWDTPEMRALFAMEGVGSR
jgi:thiol-disulfide isomerase/thioredoxin